MFGITTKKRKTMDSTIVPILWFIFTYYVIPTLVTCFATYFCHDIGVPLWAPWIVLAAYVHNTQSAIILKQEQGGG